MKMVHWVIGYAAASIVIAIAIDAAAAVAADTSSAKISERVSQIIPEILEDDDEALASRKSCQKFFERQKEVTVELAMAFAPSKGKGAKKQRRKMRREITANMDKHRAAIVDACTSIPAAEIDCVLGESDATAWAACGDGIAKLQPE